MITGPGSPSVLASMIQAIEQHVDWLADCIGHMRDVGATSIEPTLEDENAWVEHVNEVSTVSLRSTCSSWYVGTNIPGRRVSSCRISAVSRSMCRNATR